MTERLHNSAEEAVRGEADPTEGQGLGTPGAHPGGLTGGATDDVGDLPTQNDERADAARAGGVEDTELGETEGMRSIARAEQRRPDLPTG